MRISIDPGFLREARRLELRFTCADCGNLRPPQGGTTPVCAHGWPNEQHLAPPDEDATEVMFCKEFELE